MARWASLTVGSRIGSIALLGVAVIAIITLSIIVRSSPMSCAMKIAATAS